MYLHRWHGWCHMKLLPFRRVLCTPYNHAPCHFMQSLIRKVGACLAETCHLYFWQNDRDLLRVASVTRGGTDTEIRVSTESWSWRRKFSRRSCRDSNPWPFNHEFGALTTELSPLQGNGSCQQVIRSAWVNTQFVWTGLSSFCFVKLFYRSDCVMLTGLQWT